MTGHAISAPILEDAGYMIRVLPLSQSRVERPCLSTDDILKICKLLAKGKPVVEHAIHRWFRFESQPCAVRRRGSLLK